MSYSRPRFSWRLQQLERRRGARYSLGAALSLGAGAGDMRSSPASSTSITEEAEGVTAVAALADASCLVYTEIADSPNVDAKRFLLLRPPGLE